jgi:hypothetical protein
LAEYIKANSIVSTYLGPITYQRGEMSKQKKKENYNYETDKGIIAIKRSRIGTIDTMFKEAFESVSEDLHENDDVQAFIEGMKKIAHGNFDPKDDDIIKTFLFVSFFKCRNIVTKNKKLTWESIMNPDAAYRFVSKKNLK